ncbi:MAG: hypothetical protein O7C98_09570, partial [Planctomycetota bacterium]|nr:hypothetical protein [Planctomycetota bacterium]
MRHILPAMLCLLLLLPSGSLLAQEVELDQKAKKLEQLKEKEDRLQKELEAVKKLRERAQEDLRQARAEQMVKAMRARIEELTPRRFTQKVDVGFQTKSEFRAAAEEMMAEELPPELVEGQSTAWAALGLMPLNTDLQEMLLDVVVSQAAAYYNPKTDTFYVVAELPKGQAETIFLHELQHAMQDQVLGLDDIWAKALESGNDDRAQAVRFLVEGEATYLMTVHELGKMLKRMKAPPGQLDAALGAQLKAASNMPYDKMMASMEAMAKTIGGDMAEATRKAKELPPFVMRSLIDAYYRGAYAVHEVKAARGWKGVDELFADPPTSTEQMLHPHKLLGDKREEPIAVEVPVKVARELGEGWTKAYESTLGEASILILLTDQMPKAQRDAAVAAAAGWGGDRFVAFRRLGGIKLVYRFDWKALSQEQRADAYERALTTLHKRFEEAGFDIRPDLNLEGEVNV